MDPDKTLEQIREEIRKLRRWMRHPSYSDHDNRLSEAEELVDLVEALDGWLTKGGFLPKDWNK